VDTPLDTVTFNTLSAEEQEAIETLPRSDQVRAAYESASAAVQTCWLRAAEVRERRRIQNGQERERAAGRLDRVRVARDKGKIPQSIPAGRICVGVCASGAGEV
jgi:hypothetical protein